MISGCIQFNYRLKYVKDVIEEIISKFQSKKQQIKIANKAACLAFILWPFIQ